MKWSSVEYVITKLAFIFLISLLGHILFGIYDTLHPAAKLPPLIKFACGLCLGWLYAMNRIFKD